MRALLAPYDKTGLIDFAKGLVGLGWELIATGDTERQLREAGLPVISVAEVIGFPEILDGRVKTLHPAIHGGLAGAARRPEHMKTLAEHGMTGIDLVANNLYPFEETVAKPGVSHDRGAGEHRHRRAGDAAGRGEELRGRGRAVRPIRLRRDAGVAAGRGRRRRHAAAAGREGLPARGRVRHAGRALPQGRRGPLPGRAFGGHATTVDLHYGENPHQKAALYEEPGLQGGIVHVKQLHGAPISFNNMLDADAAWRTVSDFDRTNDRDHQAHQPLRPGRRTTTWWTHTSGR